MSDLTIDAVSSTFVTGDADSTYSWNHTISSDANLLLIALGARDGTSADLDTTYVRYNGVDATKAVGIKSTAGIVQAEIWYLLKANLPAAGTYLIEVQHNNGLSTLRSAAVGAISLENAHQAPPEASASNATGTATGTISTSITTLTDGAFVIDLVTGDEGSNTWDPDDGQTEQFDEQSGQLASSLGTFKMITAGLRSQGWTLSGVGSGNLAHALVAVRPAVSQSASAPVVIHNLRRRLH